MTSWLARSSWIARACSNRPWMVPKLYLMACLMACAFVPTASAQTYSDSCLTPPVITTLPATFNVDNTGATPSVGLLCGMSSGGSATDPDVWFAVTAPFDGLLVVEHNNNLMSHAVYVQNTPGACPVDLDLLYCDIPQNQNGSLTPALAGVTYLVRAGDNSAVAADFTVDVLPPPANDDCATPEPITNFLPSIVAYDSTGATGTPSLNPMCPAATIQRDVWFEITPAFTGTLGAFVVGSTRVQIYNNPGVGLCPVDSDLVSCGSGSVSGAVVGGSSYLLRIGSLGNGFVSGDMTIALVAGSPANNDCGTPQAVTLGSTVPVVTLGATTTASLNFKHLHRRALRVSGRRVVLGCGTG